MSCCNGNIINMLQGEVKKQEFLASSSNADDVLVITSAKYEIFDNKKEVVQSGSCEIDGTMLSLILSADFVGKFKLVITWEAPPARDKGVFYLIVGEG